MRVVKGPPAEWGACSRTVSHDSTIDALSYWDNTVAAGCASGEIIILDVITGSQTAVLSEHTGRVRSVVFSSDGRSIVSGSDDTTVKLWDVQTGGVVKTFLHGHAAWVLSVSISADHSRIASGSQDNIMCLWDIQTGECLWTIELQGNVNYLSFSPIDPHQIISVSNNTVQQWDANGYQLPPTYIGSNMALSPDHTKFALCYGKAITVQNSDLRVIVAKFHVAESITRHCCFSPDGRLVATAASINICIWDITSTDPHLVKTFFGHDWVTSLVFSSPSSLISGYGDGSIKFWQIGALSTDPVTTDQQSDLPMIMVVSLQARAGIAMSYDQNKVVKTWDISTGFCRSTFQTKTTENIVLDGTDVKLIDGRLIFAWARNREIQIWDTETGELLQKLSASRDQELRISGDGSKIFLLAKGSIQAWSMWTWEPVGEVKLGLGKEPYLDPLCIDSSRVRICFNDSSAQEGWDFGTLGSSPVPFDPSTGRPRLDFIGGPSQWTDGPCWIKDTITGKEVFRLSGRYAEPRDVQWDGQYLVAGYRC